MFASQSNSPDNLIAGALDLIPMEVTVLSGEGVLGRGTLLGNITATGKKAACQSDGTDDGRRTPECVLAEDIDATDGDIVTVAYFQGEFNENAVVFSGTDDADTHRAALLAKKVVLRPAVAA